MPLSEAACGSEMKIVSVNCAAYVSTYRYPSPSTVHRISPSGGVATMTSPSADRAPLNGVAVAREGNQVDLRTAHLGPCTVVTDSWSCRAPSGSGLPGEDARRPWNWFRSFLRAAHSSERPGSSGRRRPERS